MSTKEQKYATKKFNVISSAESFKRKVNSPALIKVYKNGQFGVRFKIDKSIPKTDGNKVVFKRVNLEKHESTL